MFRRFGLLVSAILAVCIIQAFAAKTASAAPATGISFTTSPVSLDLTIHPGTSTTKTIEIMNNNPAALPITMGLDSFSAYGTSGEAAISPLATSNPVVSYVHFSPATFVAEPGVWSQVKMTITLPKTAQLGYYFAVVFKTNLPVPTLNKSTIVRSSNSILVLIDTQSSNESRKVEIGNFTVSKKVYEYLPARFTVTIHNKGNIYLAPTGNIYISRSAELTNSLAALNINAGAGNVLPDSNRVFQATWSDGFPNFQDELSHGEVVDNKKGQPIENLKWNLSDISKFRFGHYYAGLTLIYNNGTQIVSLHGLVSFWVIPWKLLLLGLLILLLVGFAVWSLARAFYRRGKRLGSKFKKR